MLKTINVGSNRKSLLVNYNTNNIKDRCFICGKEGIHGKTNPEIYYENFGNCCHSCNSKADKTVKLNSNIDSCINKIKNINKFPPLKVYAEMTEEWKKKTIKELQEKIKDLTSELKRI
jgi:hypothetical protein